MDLFQKNQTMRFFQIGVVVFKALIHNKATRLIEFEPYSVKYVHMQINSFYVWLLSELIFQIVHHLLANAIFSVGLEDAKCQYIRMLFLLVVLNADSISSNNDIVVVGISGKLCVLISNLHVETCRVFDWKCFKV